jgi:hypothetical protein
MTVIRLESGRLILHSPINMTDETVNEIEKLGSVDYIVSPNNFHHLFVLNALKSFPKAELYVADGLEKKRPDLKNYKLLSHATNLWPGEIEVMRYEGVPKLSEYVFFHKKSKTLITTDIVFNMKTAKNWLTRIVLKIDGIYQKTSQGRLTNLLTKDKTKRLSSNQKILGLDFDKVIMAHG